MFKLILKNQIKKNFDNLKRIKSSKHFPSSTREWKNSIFLFNKSNLSLIPNTDISALAIIKSYFSLFNKSAEKELKGYNLRMRFRRLSSNKIYISNGEFKHTNNKVIINIFMFNRQKNIYLGIEKKIRIKLKRILKENEKIFLQRLENIKESIFFFSLLKYKTSSLFLSIKNIRINNYINIKIKNYCRTVLLNEKNKRLMFWYYKQINYINDSKQTYIYLQYLREELSKLYNKQVEFNLINLKRFYLNSDILAESITNKITKNRKRITKYLHNFNNKVKIKRIIIAKYNYFANNKLEKRKNMTKSTSYLTNFVIKKLKYKNVTGFRLEAKGRLTKRHTASRSALKLLYKGNLRVHDSSWKALSSVLLKGNLKSNLQYTKLKSKSRTGSFGIKGWISGT